MFCPKCGSTIQSDIKYCPNCGQQIEEGISSSDKNQGGKRIPFWFKFLILTFVILGIIGFWSLLTSQDILDPIEDQLEAIHNHQITEAYYTYTSKDFQNSTSLNAFKEFIQSHSGLANYQKFIINDKNINKNNATLNGTLTAIDKTIYHIEYKLIKEENEWKIQSIQINEPQNQKSIEKTSTEENKESPETKAMVYAVQEQLQAFHDSDYKTAYNTTSKEFQEITSLEYFKNVIAQYPILSNPDATQYAEPKIQDNAGTLEVQLKDRKGESLIIEYNLLKEAGKWKILGMEIYKDSDPKDDKVEKKQEKSLVFAQKLEPAKDIMDPINSQLRDIRNQQLKKAYYSNTSQSFKEATPYHVFEDFMNQHPAFSGKFNPQFSRLDLKKDTASISGNLIGPNSEVLYVNYDLVLEDGNWKVAQIDINDAPMTPAATEGTPPEAPALDVAKVIVGSEIDHQGLITKPAHYLPSMVKNIYVNVYVNNGVKGAAVELSIEHLDSGTKTAPLTTKLEDNGNTIVSFDFISPTEGWPKGHYLLHTTTSTGVNLTSNFKID